MIAVKLSDLKIRDFRDGNPAWPRTPPRSLAVRDLDGQLRRGPGPRPGRGRGELRPGRPARPWAWWGNRAAARPSPPCPSCASCPPRPRSTGRIRFSGRRPASCPEDRMRRIRGNRIAMVFQEPMTALNPVLTIGEQVAEVLRLHRGLSHPDGLAGSRRGPHPGGPPRRRPAPGASTRTSFPAACASGSSLPWPWPATRSCSSPMSPPPPWM